MKQQKDSFQKRVFEVIKNHTEHNNVLTIPQEIIRYCGDLDTAAFLSQLIYWCDKGKSPDGWIYKTDKEWNRETGLTSHCIRNSVKKCEGMGIIKTTKKMANRSYTWHYKLEQRAFLLQLVNFLRKDPDNFTNTTSNYSVSITEPTTKPSPELTTEPTPYKKKISIFGEKIRVEAERKEKAKANNLFHNNTKANDLFLLKNLLEN